MAHIDDDAFSPVRTGGAPLYIAVGINARNHDGVVFHVPAHECESRPYSRITTIDRGNTLRLFLYYTPGSLEVYALTCKPNEDFLGTEDHLFTVVNPLPTAVDAITAFLEKHDYHVRVVNGKH
jgi:hypothetical protein